MQFVSGTGKQSASRHRARLHVYDTFGTFPLRTAFATGLFLPRRATFFYSVAPLFLIWNCSQWLAKLPTPLLIPNQGVKLGKNPRNSSVCIISRYSSLCYYNKYYQATHVPLFFRICDCKHTYLCVTGVGIFTRWHCLYLYNKLQALYVLYVRYVSIYYWPFLLRLIPMQQQTLSSEFGLTLYDILRYTYNVGGPQPEPVVINDIYAKTGAWEDAEKLLIQLATFTLVTDNSCTLPIFFIE